MFDAFSCSCVGSVRLGISGVNASSSGIMTFQMHYSQFFEFSVDLSRFGRASGARTTASPAGRGDPNGQMAIDGSGKRGKTFTRGNDALDVEEVNVGFDDGWRIGFVQLINASNKQAREKTYNQGRTAPL